jgi:hypothetical protein
MQSIQIRWRFIANKAHYLVFNYFAYGLNFLSGLILARKLGPDNRGVFAYLSNLYLVTLYLAPLNAKNAASIAEASVQGVHEIPKRGINRIKLFILSLILTMLLSLTYLLFLRTKIDLKILVIFCIANLFNAFGVLNQTQEGKFRTQHRLNKLAMLRFLGYATPSILIFILFFLNMVKVEYVIFGQSVAMLSCFGYLYFYDKSEKFLRIDKFAEGMKKTFASYTAEYFVNFVPLILVTITEDFQYLGFFAIAYGYSLIADTYFQIVESRIYFDLANRKASIEFKVFSVFPKNVRNLFISQIIFIPLALLIPFLYGHAYEVSSKLAVVLIVSKFLYSIIKMQNIYFNVLFENFKIPVYLNFCYLFFAFGAFEISHGFLELRHPWGISIIIAGLITSLVGIVYLFRLTRKYVKQKK